MKDIETTLISNEAIAERVFRLSVAVEWSEWTPGQFVMVEVPGSVVFLRRPFGIADVNEGQAQICYKVVGKGTEALSALEVGARLRVLGPLGKGFALPDEGKTAVLVAGGYGLAPLMGLARRLRAGGRAVVFYVGARSGSDLFLTDEIAACGIDLRIATDDGSSGEKGVVTDRLAREIASIAEPELFACGPDGMLRAIAEFSRAKDIPTQVSMESYMACGIGVCLGCACETASGEYVRTCREGPVFRVEELRL